MSAIDSKPGWTFKAYWLFAWWPSVYRNTTRNSPQTGAPACPCYLHLASIRAIKQTVSNIIAQVSTISNFHPTWQHATAFPSTFSYISGRTVNRILWVSDMLTVEWNTLTHFPESQQLVWVIKGEWKTRQLN